MLRRLVKREARGVLRARRMNRKNSRKARIYSLLVKMSLSYRKKLILIIRSGPTKMKPKTSIRNMKLT